MLKNVWAYYLLYGKQVLGYHYEKKQPKQINSHVNEKKKFQNLYYIKGCLSDYFENFGMAHRSN